MGVAYYKGDCPHCGAKGAGFTSVGQHVLGEEANQAEDWSVFMTCNLCSRGIVLEVHTTTGQRMPGPMSWPQSLTLSTATTGQPDQHFDIRNVYPVAPVSRAPEDVPSKIAAAYVEASDNLHTGHFETCAILSRKVIDLATKDVRGDAAKSETLYQRIDVLKTQGVITAAMADWAHAVRLDGNESTHSDDTVTEDEAADLLDFTHAFLLYAFTLPAMVDRRANPAG